MNKPFSTKAILVNILILLLLMTALVGIFLTGNGTLFYAATCAFFFLSLFSIIYYSKKRKLSKTPQAQPATPYGSVIQPKVSRTSVVLEVLLIISALVEIYFAIITVIAFANPGPASIGVILTVPVCVVNGCILAALIAAHHSSSKKK